MRKHILFLTALFFSSILSAQSSDNYIGQSMILAAADVTEINDGENGVGVTWDYQWLQAAETTTFNETTSPAENLNYMYFGNADITNQSDNGQSTYWSLQDGSRFFMGYENNHSMLVLDDPLQYPMMPLQMGTSYSDEASGVFHGACMDSEWLAEMTVEVLGSGTLMLPNQTYENAVKAKFTKTISKKREISDNFKSHHFEQFVWFVDGHVFPILEINNWQRDVCYGESEGTDVNFMTYGETTEMGLVEDVMELSVYPNPTDGLTTIDVKSMDTKSSVLEIRDVSGKLIQPAQFVALNKGATLVDIDLSDIEPGMYTVTLRTGDQVTSERVVVE